MADVTGLRLEEFEFCDVTCVEIVIPTFCQGSRFFRLNGIPLIGVYLDP